MNENIDHFNFHLLHLGTVSVKSAKKRIADILFLKFVKYVGKHCVTRQAWSITSKHIQMIGLTDVTTLDVENPLLMLDF